MGREIGETRFEWIGNCWSCWRMWRGLLHLCFHFHIHLKFFIIKFKNSFIILLKISSSDGVIKQEEWRKICVFMKISGSVFYWNCAHLLVSILMALPRNRSWLGHELGEQEQQKQHGSTFKAISTFSHQCI